MSHPQRPDGANRPQRVRPPLVSNARPQPEPAAVPVSAPLYGDTDGYGNPVPTTREEREIERVINAARYARQRAARPEPWYLQAVDALMVMVGLWWLFGPLVVAVLLLCGVVDAQTVEGWWL